MAIVEFGTESLRDYGNLSKTAAGFVNAGMNSAILWGVLLAAFTGNGMAHRKRLLIGIPLMALVDVASCVLYLVSVSYFL